MVSVITIVSSVGWPLVVVSRMNEACWYRPGWRFSRVQSFLRSGTAPRPATGDFETLQQTLQEEAQADKKLTAIAESHVNVAGGFGATKLVSSVLAAIV
jgi:hypothetical protein